MYEDIFNNLEIEAQKIKEKENKRKELLKEENIKERQINIDFSYKYKALENMYRKTYDNIISEHQKLLKLNRDFYHEQIKNLFS